MAFEGVRLFVGGIPRGVTIDDVRELFARFNASSVTMARDRKTYRRKGIAYVIVPSHAEAERAIAMLDGLELGGRKLTARIADATPPRRRR